MNSNDLFAILCAVEANVHMIKSHYLTKDGEKLMKHIQLLNEEVQKINDNFISGDGTRLYIPK